MNHNHDFELIESDLHPVAAAADRHPDSEAPPATAPTEPDPPELSVVDGELLSELESEYVSRWLAYAQNQAAVERRERAELARRHVGSGWFAVGSRWRGGVSGWRDGAWLAGRSPCGTPGTWCVPDRYSDTGCAGPRWIS